MESTTTGTDSDMCIKIESVWSEQNGDAYKWEDRTPVEEKQEEELKPKIWCSHDQRRREIRNGKCCCGDCGKWICPECLVVLNTTVAVHFISRDTTTFACSNCPLLLPSRCSYQAHSRLHLQKPPFVCPDCGLLCHKMQTLVSHLRQSCFHVHKIMQYTCTFCNTTLIPRVGKDDYPAHMTNHMEHTVIGCSACKVVFDGRGQWKSHAQQYHPGTEARGVGCFVCRICANLAMENSEFQAHLNFHVENSTLAKVIYLCTCDKGFESSRLFMSHLYKCPGKYKLPPEWAALENSGKCNICGNPIGFLTPGSYHMKFAPSVCNTCYTNVRDSHIQANREDIIDSLERVASLDTNSDDIIPSAYRRPQIILTTRTDQTATITSQEPDTGKKSVTISVNGTKHRIHSSDSDSIGVSRLRPIAPKLKASPKSQLFNPEPLPVPIILMQKTLKRCQPPDREALSPPRQWSPPKEPPPPQKKIPSEPPVSPPFFEATVRPSKALLPNILQKKSSTIPISYRNVQLVEEFPPKNIGQEVPLEVEENESVTFDIKYENIPDDHRHYCKTSELTQKKKIVESHHEESVEEDISEDVGEDNSGGEEMELDDTTGMLQKVQRTSTESSIPVAGRAEGTDVEKSENTKNTPKPTMQKKAVAKKTEKPPGFFACPLCNGLVLIKKSPTEIFDNYLYHVIKMHGDSSLDVPVAIGNLPKSKQAHESIPKRDSWEEESVDCDEVDLMTRWKVAKRMRGRLEKKRRRNRVKQRNTSSVSATEASQSSSRDVELKKITKTHPNRNEKGLLEVDDPSTRVAISRSSPKEENQKEESQTEDPAIARPKRFSLLKCLADRKEARRLERGCSSKEKYPVTNYTSAGENPESQPNHDKDNSTFHTEENSKEFSANSPENINKSMEQACSKSRENAIVSVPLAEKEIERSEFESVPREPNLVTAARKELPCSKSDFNGEPKLVTVPLTDKMPPCSELGGLHVEPTAVSIPLAIQGDKERGGNDTPKQRHGSEARTQEMDHQVTPPKKRRRRRKKTLIAESPMNNVVENHAEDMDTSQSPDAETKSRRLRSREAEGTPQRKDREVWEEFYANLELAEGQKYKKAKVTVGDKEITTLNSLTAKRIVKKPQRFIEESELDEGTENPKNPDNPNPVDVEVKMPSPKIEKEKKCDRTSALSVIIQQINNLPHKETAATRSEEAEEEEENADLSIKMTLNKTTWTIRKGEEKERKRVRQKKTDFDEFTFLEKTFGQDEGAPNRRKRKLSSKLVYNKRLSMNLEAEEFPSGQYIPSKGIQTEQKWSCVCCNVTYHDRAQFRSHIVEHRVDESSVQCMECGECFVVRPSWEKHLRAYHKVKDLGQYMMENGYEKVNDVLNENQCKVCKDEFESPSELKKHFRVHGMAFLQMARKTQKDSSAPYT